MCTPRATVRWGVFGVSLASSGPNRTSAEASEISCAQQSCFLGNVKGLSKSLIHHHSLRAPALAGCSLARLPRDLPEAPYSDQQRESS